MKAIIATTVLFFVAGVCIAGPQPIQRRTNSNIANILSYNNIIAQKAKPCAGPKVYALAQEFYQTPSAVIQQPSNNGSGSASNQIFSPNPLVNYYKEFR